MTMGAVYRLAKRKDAGRLYDIRRRSIPELAPPTMPKAEAQAWASQLTLSGMERKLREPEVWVAELDGVIVGWGAIRSDRLEGLYAAPEFCRAGHWGRIARYARRTDARTRHPGGAGRSQFKRAGILAPARLSGEWSSNAKWGLAHCKGTSITASGEAEAVGSDGREKPAYH